MRLSISQRETLYHEVAQMLRSGFPLPEACEVLSREALGGAVKEFLRALKDRLKAGDLPEEAFPASGFSFPDMELTLLAAGNASGRLDKVFDDLSRQLAAIREAREKMWRGMLYPLFLLHLAPLLLASPAFFSGSKSPGAITLGLLQFYFVAYLVAGAVAGVLYLLYSGAAKAPVLDALAGALPLGGKIHRSFALFRFCSALNLQLDAAVAVPAALRRAGEAAHSARIRGAAERAYPKVQAGSRLADAFSETAGLPAPLKRSIRVGEETGSLDEELSKWAELSRRRGLDALDLAASVIPKALNLVIILFIGWKIIAAYSGILSTYTSILDGMF
jgi:type IV pilus assembly protein PilC